MPKHRYYPILFLFCVLFPSCFNDIHLSEEAILISSGNTTVTVGDYMNALEITKAAYPSNMTKNEKAFKGIKTRLLAQMVEELVILKTAEEKNLLVTDDELKTAVENVRKDYPEGAFEEELLRNAIPYKLWENRLKNNLLMNKVISHEFDSKITISPEEMKAYYEKNKKELQSELKSGRTDVYKRIVRKMRREKKQREYQQWMDKKKVDYSIEVNDEMWEKIVGS